MSGPLKSEKAADVEKTSLEALLDSPVRLLTLCGALLLFSLMTGMVIGGLIKENGEFEDVAKISQENTLLSQPQSLAVPSTSGLTASVEPDNGGSKPVDALEYDASDYRLAPQGAVMQELSENNSEETSEKEIETAALPPAILTPKRKAAEGVPAWQKYAALSPILDGRPRIAMVIDDVGLNSSRVRELIALPSPLTLSFLPYAHGLQDFTEQTRAQGHEVMLHMPMEPLRSTADPGPDALLNALSLDEIRARTVKNLAQFSGYVGVNNHMGSKFTAYEAGMAVVMDILAQEGLLFLDSRTTAKSKGYKLARARNMPTGNRDVFIDNDINETAINKQLAMVEKQARKNGIVIAIGHPHPDTIRALAKWIPEARKKGFQFIPVTAALTRKTTKVN